MPSGLSLEPLALDLRRRDEHRQQAPLGGGRERAVFFAQQSRQARGIGQRHDPARHGGPDEEDRDKTQRRAPRRRCRSAVAYFERRIAVPSCRGSGINGRDGPAHDETARHIDQMMLPHEQRGEPDEDEPHLHRRAQPAREMRAVKHPHQRAQADVQRRREVVGQVVEVERVKQRRGPAHWLRPGQRQFQRKQQVTHTAGDGDGDEALREQIQLQLAAAEKNAPQKNRSSDQYGTTSSLTNGMCRSHSNISVGTSPRVAVK
jgi:hypothetical protein